MFGDFGNPDENSYESMNSAPEATTDSCRNSKSGDELEEQESHINGTKSQIFFFASFETLTVPSDLM